MAEVRIQDVTKVFNDEVTAVDNVSFTIPDRTVVCLLGPSGCGKTTMMRMIAGLEEPTSGRIYFGDRDITDLSVRDRDVAMVFQFPAVYPHLNVWDNIAFPLVGQKMEPKTIQKKVTEVAEILNVQDYLQEMPRSLDTGMKQKVSIARAVVRKPMVFLFDEPLSNVDPNLRVELKSTIKMLSKELGQTFVYVTHDQSEAMTLADQIAIMRDGALLQFTSPDRIYDYPTNPFVGWFLGNPGMNFIEGEITKTSNGYKIQINGNEYEEADLPDLQQTGNLLLGIRPEFIEISKESPGAKWINAKCKLVEPMGGRNIIHVSMGNKDVRVKTITDTDWNVGEDVYLRFPKHHLRFFDPGDLAS